MRIIFCLIPLIYSFSILGQIVDDSTQWVYGTHTTKYISGGNIMNNLASYQEMDTSLYLFEQQLSLDRPERRFQHLGIFGTALFPVFYTSQTSLGRTSGYNAYSQYAFQPPDIKYYDTKSPYSNVLVHLGGGNRNLVDVAFSRNINENWNFGFDLRKITSDKQLAKEREGDRQIVGSSFVAHTHYLHPNKNYRVFFHHSRMNHKIVELGGVRYTSDSLLSDLFQFDNALLRLDEAQNVSKERRWYLYHDYHITDRFQFYHQLNHRKEENTYQDFSDGGTINGYDTYRDFYPNFFLNDDSTYQQATFTTFENEGGFKQDLSNVFYRAYVKIRTVDFQYHGLDIGSEKVEKYVGGYMRFKWKEKFSLTGHGEYLIGGGYSVGGTLSNNLINVSYRATKFNVPFIYTNYSGNHHQWSNSLDPVLTNSLGSHINLDFKWLELIPRVNFTTYHHFIYFDHERQPQQSDRVIISEIGGDINIKFKNAKDEGWHLENDIQLSNATGSASNFVRIPTIFYNGRYFWRGNWFRDKVPIEIGISTHARSAYFANAYAPEIQQFYLQNEFKLTRYFKADLFMNLRLSNFFLSFKFTHFDQPNDGGYFASPYYPGQPRVIDLAIRWMFFD